MGLYMKTKGFKRVYLMAPNYPAGKDMLAGFKRYFKGEIVDEVYTTFGQLDYAAEIAQLRAKKPEAVFFFYPGGMGINFVKQYAQAGLKAEIPLYGPASRRPDDAAGDRRCGDGLYASTSGARISTTRRARSSRRFRGGVRPHPLALRRAGL